MQLANSLTRQSAPFHPTGRSLRRARTATNIDSAGTSATQASVSGRMLRRIAGTLAICSLLIGQVAAQVRPSHVDLLMFRDPVLPKSSFTVVYPQQLKPLWLKALGRPEPEIVQVAADTIAIAHQHGMPDLTDTAPLLIGLLEQPNQSPAVTRSSVHALIALDAKEAQDLLWNLAQQSELDLAGVIEPTLAAWDYEPARDEWLSRLRDPTTRPSLLRLAISSLATTKELAAGDDLLRLVLRRDTPAAIRLASARALIAVGRSDLVDAAKQLRLRRDRDALADVLAATLLGNDSSPAAVALYRTLVQSRNSGAAVIAAEGLFSIDPAHLADLTGEMLRHKDVSIRRIAARVLVAAPNTDNILALTTLLSDINPSMRRWTAERLVEFGQQEEWNDIVIGETVSLIDSASWRGIEQAVVVLARLDHKPIALQLVSLLDHERPEVYITAAWALREIQVQETLQPMLAKAQSHFQSFKDNVQTMPIPPGEHVAQLCQLFQAFGRMKFREAVPLLREFVPKMQELGDDSRAAACWALGHICEDDPPDELVQQLIQRLKDQNPDNPELLDVRIMCAISLGRMKSPTAVEPLQLVEHRRGPDDSLGQACGWALEISIGQPRRELRPRIYSMTSWFLTPILN